MGSTSQLGTEDQQRVEAAIRAAEAAARVEIVVSVSHRSGSYAQWLAGPVALATVGLAVAAHALFPELSFGLLLGAQLPVAAGLWAVLRAWPRFALALIPDGVEIEAVQREALRLFAAHAVFETAARTGALIHVSSFERRVHILADKGLAGHLDPAFCRSEADLLAKAMANGETATGLCTLVARIAAAAAPHFPVRPGEARANELPETT